MRSILTLAFLVASSAARPAIAAQPDDCERLGHGTQVGEAVVTLAQSVKAGDFTGTEGAKLSGLPSFCRIVAIASPHPSSRILVEVWMPDAERWNGKLLGIGSGGAAGKINSAQLAGGLKRGFAAATTDLGTYPAGLSDIGFNFGDGRPEQIRDFGMRSTHAMTALAKEVVHRYYDKAAARSYFMGCSTGGQQALREAQDFPGDYDGIVAGAPAHNRTHLHARFEALRQLGTRPGTAIPMPLMAAWTRAIVKACAGRDGGAPADHFLTNPLQCTVSPRDLACKKDGAAEGCLSEAQVSALETVYAGIRNPRTGEPIYFPDVRGAEESLFLVYGAAYFSKNFDVTHWILPPDRPSSSFDFDRDLAALDEAFSKDVNAMDPDLSAFAKRGGKLILYHGWTDGLISPIDSIDYYQRISAGDRKREEFARLFLVPGMDHCAEGRGATNFGQAVEKEPRAGATAANDVILALDRWLEKGVAPDELIAGKSSRPFFLPAYAMTEPTPEARPICAFPALPRYDGKGDPLKVGSFKCAPAKFPDYPRPPPQYLD